MKSHLRQTSPHIKQVYTPIVIRFGHQLVDNFTAIIHEPLVWAKPGFYSQMKEITQQKIVHENMVERHNGKKRSM